MGATKVDNGKKKKENDSSQKGTFISVGVVGVVILLTYLLLYGLYMSRV